MMGREKVVKGLECCAAMSGDKCRECPYSKECLDADLPYGMPHLAADALALLKTQEPVEPIRMNHDENKYKDHYRCPICKEDLSYEQNYCPDCGRKVKWQ